MGCNAQEVQTVIRRYFRKYDPKGIFKKMPVATFRQRELALRKAWGQFPPSARLAFYQKILQNEVLSEPEQAALKAKALAVTGPCNLAAAAECTKLACVKFENAKRSGAKCLFYTYHSQDWVFSREELGKYTAAVRSMETGNERFHAVLRDDPQFSDLFHNRIALDAAKIVEAVGAHRYSVGLELCMETFMESGVVRLHAHFVLEWLDFIRVTGKTQMSLAGVQPVHVSVQTKLRRRRSDSGALHFYVQAEKLGRVHSCTNYVALKDFSVNPRLITEWYAKSKLGWPSARRAFINIGVNVIGNLANIDRCNREKKSLVIADLKTAIQMSMPQLSNFKVFPQTTAFLGQFDHPRRRYKFYVLVGPSMYGKTSFACHLFKDPQNMLCVSCSNTLDPDLTAFDYIGHRGIVFDEGKAEMVLKYKGLFQAGVYEVTIGQSPTQQFAQRLFVSGTAMIITSNSWHQELAALDPAGRAWLETNSILHEVTGNMWEEVA